MPVAKVHQMGNAFPAPDGANCVELKGFVYSEAHGTRLVIYDGKGHIL